MTQLISYKKEELTWPQRLAVKLLSKFIFTEEQTELRFRYTFMAGGYYGSKGEDSEKAWEEFKNNDRKI